MQGTGDEVVYLRTGTAAGVVVRRPRLRRRLRGGHRHHRWVPTGGDGKEPVAALVIEARATSARRRYLSEAGQLLEHSPYCERDLHGPVSPHLVDDDPGDDGVEVLVRQRAGLTRYRYACHPFDVVGWDGCLYPYRLSIHDFEPITGRVHQPPPVHQTFAGPRFVVCSFVPRKLDYHPAAVPTPYNHANVDSDEVLFYCAGDFTSRKGAGIGPGRSACTPEASRTARSRAASRRRSAPSRPTKLAVMIDTFAPLALAGWPGCEDPDYAWTWAAAAR